MGARRYVPLADGARLMQVVVDDGIILRRECTRVVMASPTHGENGVQAFERVRHTIENISLPPGYALAWGGECESLDKASAA